MERIEVEINNPEILEYIKKLGTNNVYLVGGTVRDILTGKKPKDLDFVVTDFDKALKLAEEMNLPIHEDPHFCQTSTVSVRSRYLPHRCFFTWGCVPHRSRVYPYGNPA